MHLGDEICTIDIDRGDLAGQNFSAIEEAVQDVVEADFPTFVLPKISALFPYEKSPPREKR
jgi:alanyl-tRNA synthetase